MNEREIVIEAHKTSSREYHITNNTPIDCPIVDSELVPIMFKPQMNCSRVHWEPDWDNLLKPVSVWLFWPRPAQMNGTKWRKQTIVWLNWTKYTYFLLSPIQFFKYCCNDNQQFSYCLGKLLYVPLSDSRSYLCSHRFPCVHSVAVPPQLENCSHCLTQRQWKFITWPYFSPRTNIWLLVKNYPVFYDINT